MTPKPPYAHSPSLFSIGPDDVVVAAASLGYDVDEDAAAAMLKGTAESELLAVCVAAVDGAADPERRTAIARAAIAGLISNGVMGLPPRLRN
jgi:hypothetical protein